MLVPLMYVQGQRLREYPTGMSLMVPPVTTSITQSYTSYGMRQIIQPAAQSAPIEPVDVSNLVLEVQFDTGRQELLFDAGQSVPVRVGEWVIITVAGKLKYWEHYSCDYANWHRAKP